MNFFNIVQELIEVEDTCESEIFNEKLVNLQKFIGVESVDVAGIFFLMFFGIHLHQMKKQEQFQIISLVKYNFFKKLIDFLYFSLYNKALKQR